MAHQARQLLPASLREKTALWAQAYVNHDATVSIDGTETSFRALTLALQKEYVSNPLLPIAALVGWDEGELGAARLEVYRGVARLTLLTAGLIELVRPKLDGVMADDAEVLATDLSDHVHARPLARELLTELDRVRGRENPVPFANRVPPTLHLHLGTVELGASWAHGPYVDRLQFQTAPIESRWVRSSAEEVIESMIAHRLRWPMHSAPWRGRTDDPDLYLLAIIQFSASPKAKHRAYATQLATEVAAKSVAINQAVDDPWARTERFRKANFARTLYREIVNSPETALTWCLPALAPNQRWTEYGPTLPRLGPDEEVANGFAARSWMFALDRGSSPSQADAQSLFRAMALATATDEQRMAWERRAPFAPAVQEIARADCDSIFSFFEDVDHLSARGLRTVAASRVVDHVLATHALGPDVEDRDIKYLLHALGAGLEWTGSKDIAAPPGSSPPGLTLRQALSPADARKTPVQQLKVFADRLLASLPSTQVGDTTTIGLSFPLNTPLLEFAGGVVRLSNSVKRTPAPSPTGVASVGPAGAAPSVEDLAVFFGPEESVRIQASGHAEPQQSGQARRPSGLGHLAQTPAL